MRIFASYMKVDLFIVYLLLSVVLAYFFPGMAMYQEGLPLHTVTTIGVSLIFFFYGLKMSLAEIKRGLRNWRLHLLVQSITFLVFPLLILAFRPFIHTHLQEQFWLSFFFLAALPSTVSSSVVMVAIARGNLSAAIFNASLSGLIAVIITPLWMSMFLSFESTASFSEVYWGLIKEIIIPIILGLLLQRYWGSWAKKYTKALSNFDKTVILMIVYMSFAESFSNGIFQQISNMYLLGVFAGVIVLFVMVYGLVGLISGKLGFNREDRIVALFCGSKKSLTHGSVFGKLLFANSASAGLYFLPLMLYHAFQIFVITFIAQQYGKESREKER